MRAAVTVRVYANDAPQSAVPEDDRYTVQAFASSIRW